VKTKNLTLAEAIKTGLPFREMRQSSPWSEKIHAMSWLYSFRQATEPIWEVKRKPGEWEVKAIPRTWEMFECGGQLLRSSEKIPFDCDCTLIKVREVLD
jgi:hypothetical protein